MKRENFFWGVSTAAAQIEAPTWKMAKQKAFGTGHRQTKSKTKRTATLPVIIITGTRRIFR